MTSACFAFRLSIFHAYRGNGVPGRFGFAGEEAPEDMKSLYVGKRVPDEYRKQGAANPIKYTVKR